MLAVPGITCQYSRAGASCHRRRRRQKMGELMRMRSGRVLAVLVLAMSVIGAPGTQAEDRHAGYYYPEAKTSEEYVSRARVLDDADRRKRIDFINRLTTEQLKLPYAPQYALFAKGEDAEKAILVALAGGYLDTPYRMRGLLAMLTAIVRQSEFFKEYRVDDFFTFFD